MRALNLFTMALVALPISGCGAIFVADKAADAVIFTGTTAVKTAAGATKLVYRGSAAAVGALTRSEDGYAEGTIVCYDTDGEIYAAAREVDGKTVCPPPR